MFKGTSENFWVELGRVMPVLSTAELAILLALGVIMRGEVSSGARSISMQEIRRMTGLSFPTLSRGISGLKKAGLLHVESRGHMGQANLYHFGSAPDVLEPTKDLVAPMENSVSFPLNEADLQERHFENWKRGMTQEIFSELRREGVRDQLGMRQFYLEKIWKPLLETVALSEIAASLSKNVRGDDNG